MACTVVADRLGERGAVQFPVRRVERVQLGSAVVTGGTGSHPSSKWGANPIAQAATRRRGDGAPIAHGAFKCQRNVSVAPSAPCRVDVALSSAHPLLQNRASPDWFASTPKALGRVVTAATPDSRSRNLTLATVAHYSYPYVLLDDHGDAIAAFRLSGGAPMRTAPSEDMAHSPSAEWQPSSVKEAGQLMLPRVAQQTATPLHATRSKQDLDNKTPNNSNSPDVSVGDERMQLSPRG
ncbi:hypothetical protein CGC20_18990 [Leishmania donovani]|uniref:Uncharacterized protein n=1 Tax=Leishmania donovani TaxID=5661 RepID=A0A504XKW7_LEIDO|nr:hypothetical protein CGC20_18990 [Leishmania donovani]